MALDYPAIDNKLQPAMAVLKPVKPALEKVCLAGANVENTELQTGTARVEDKNFHCAVYPPSTR